MTSPLPRQWGQLRSTTKKPCWARTRPASFELHAAAELFAQIFGMLLRD
jgi:hypothetical protein